MSVFNAAELTKFPIGTVVFMVDDSGIPEHVGHVVGFSDAFDVISVSVKFADCKYPVPIAPSNLFLIGDIG